MKKPIKGIVLSFFGLGGAIMYNVDFTDDIIDVRFKEYDHCDKDEAVKIQSHSDRFVEKM